jgi:hypothetical protein
MTDLALDATGPTLSVDASTHLEEILGDAIVEPLAGHRHTGVTRLVELIGPHLRLRGHIRLGHYPRLTDLVNSQDGLIRITDAIVLRRNGDPTRVSVPDLWIAPPEVTIIADLDGSEAVRSSHEMHIPKAPTGLIVVTPGHTVTGTVYTPPGAQLEVFIESPTPQFVPMTDVHTRSLADRRVRAHYGFAVLNRRHVVAASPMPEHLDAVRQRL